MIKYICDKCGKESDSQGDYSERDPELSYDDKQFLVSVLLCNTCVNELSKKQMDAYHAATNSFFTVAQIVEFKKQADERRSRHQNPYDDDCD